MAPDLIPRPLHAEFSRYVLAGGVAFAADFGLLALLASGLDMPYLLATLFAFLFGSWVNYQISVRWVFCYRALPERRAEFILFLIVGVVNLGLSLLLMAWMVEWLHMHYLVAKCVVAGFTLFANFAGRRGLLFTRWKPRVLPVQTEVSSAEP